MKIKTRLIISFGIIILLPITLFIAAMCILYAFQANAMYKVYGTEVNTVVDVYELFSNSLQIMSSYTQEEFTEMSELAQTSPESLEDLTYLVSENEILIEKNSFLVFRKGDSIEYNGYTGETVMDEDTWLEALPAYGSGTTSLDDSQTGASYYIDGDTKLLLKQIDFLCSDDSEGSIFIVTSAESILPEIKHMMIGLALAVIMVLAFTAVVMTVWIYRGTISPIRKLQVATNNIKEGNLDFTIDYDAEDEFGDLCRNFNEMRQRLKESTEEKMANERENKALISNIAHDLKTPITAVKGYAEGIIDGVADTPEKRDRYIRTIYNKATEMDRLLNELTIYSQIDTNRIPYNFRKINVEEYFQDCIAQIGLDLETRGIGLTYFNYADADIVIIADPEQLMRVINNIISNACKYMDKTRGQINIRIKDVGDFIQVEIEDNGRGIAAKDLPYIFDRFYRTDASRNSATGGSGIGLSIVRKIIEDHGGKIWATSRENTGTIMYFVIRKYQEVINE